MRLSADRQTIIGDIVGVPRWLAEIMATAYPSRSIEGALDAETVTGHKWRLVITDLALLGVRWPGVSTLEDLKTLFSDSGPEGVEVVEGERMGVTAAQKAVNAGVNVDDVRRQYYDGLTSDQAWWWVRAIYLDPNELIVDDDEGGLYRVGFTVKGDGITFDEPQAVKVEYVDVKSAPSKKAAAGLAVLTGTGEQAVAFASRAESRPDNNDQEVNQMSPELIQRLRDRLGLTADQLPDDATDEQISAALAAEPEQPEGAAPEGEPEAEGAEAPEAAEQPEPVAASTPPAGTVMVPAETWRQVQLQAAQGAQVAVRAESERRAGIIAAAVQEGRIAPSQRDHFGRLFDTDPEGAERLLTAAVEQGGLMPGTIPVQARGADPSPSDHNQEAYPASWLPELAERATSPITTEV